MFALLVVLLNMLITLMADIYKRVKGVQSFVFLKGEGTEGARRRGSRVGSDWSAV